MSELRILKGRCESCRTALQVNTRVSIKIVPCPKCGADATLTVPVDEQPPTTPSPLTVSCPNCDSPLLVPADAVGQTTTCRECGQEVWVPEPLVPPERPVRRRSRTDVGPKNECPACGSDQVKGMSLEETKRRYGNVFTLSQLRQCVRCGHGYEAYPSVGGCYAMMFFSAGGMVVGSVIVLAAVVMPFLLLAAVGKGAGPVVGGRPVLYHLVMVVLGAISGATMAYVSYRAFAKYYRFLSIAGGPDDGPTSG